MKTTGKLGKYSWVIDENEWTTLYIGDPNDHNTLFDGLINGDPEEAILNSIIKGAAEEEFGEVLDNLMKLWREREANGDRLCIYELVEELQCKYKRRRKIQNQGFYTTLKT
jgi:hypothetical protein